jgi:hypothetical protein
VLFRRGRAGEFGHMTMWQVASRVHAETSAAGNDMRVPQAPWSFTSETLTEQDAFDSYGLRIWFQSKRR